MIKKIANRGTSEIYRSTNKPDLMFFWNTDRYSIGGKTFKERIHYKGLIRNQMTIRWMRMLAAEGIVGNHIYTTCPKLLIKYGFKNLDAAGCVIAARTCIPLPIECIVRGYYVPKSKSWQQYKKSNNMYGNPLPKDLKDYQQLPEPIYTPATCDGINMTCEQSVKILEEFIQKVFILSQDADVTQIAEVLAEELKEKSLKAYCFAYDYAIKKDLIIADAKLEFGLLLNPDTKKHEIVLIGNVFTSDNCRYWDAKTYAVGQEQFSMGNRCLKEYLSKVLNWDGDSDPPQIPELVRKGVSDAYCDIFQRLFEEDVIYLSSDFMWTWKEAIEEIEAERINQSTERELEEHFPAEEDICD